MVLYRGLVKDQLNASRNDTMIRTQAFSRSRGTGHQVFMLICFQENS